MTLSRTALKRNVYMIAIYVWNCCTGADDSNFRCLTTVHLLLVLLILVATVHLLLVLLILVATVHLLSVLFILVATVHLLSVLFILVATVHLLNSINFGCNWGVNGSIHFGCNWGVNGCELCEAGRYEVGEA